MDSSTVIKISFSDVVSPATQERSLHTCQVIGQIFKGLFQCTKVHVQSGDCDYLHLLFFILVDFLFSLDLHSAASCNKNWLGRIRIEHDYDEEVIAPMLSVLHHETLQLFTDFVEARTRLFVASDKDKQSAVDAKLSHKMRSYVWSMRSLFATLM
jgi:hypothetical protein